MVSSAVRQGRRLVAVTMNAPDDWNDHIQLLNEGYSRFTICKIITKGDVLDAWEVAGGDLQKVRLIADDDYSCPIAEGEKVEIQLYGVGFVYAPVAEGQPAGVAYICVDGEAVGKVSVVYGDTVEQTKPKKSFWTSLFGGDS